MNTLEAAIKTGEIIITNAINDVTKAAWEAGRNTGMETAAVIADGIATKATTPQGKGAAGAVAKQIRNVMEQVQ